MSGSGEKIDSSSSVRALLFTTALGLLWCGLLAYLILVVPKYESRFIDNRMAIPFVTELCIYAARWCVRYWYAAVFGIIVLFVGAGALFVRIRRSSWLSWGIWLFLASMPMAGIVVAWKFVAELPIPFRLIPRGELHFEARSGALKASPEIERDWQAQLAKLGFKDIALDSYLVFLDPLWDREQRIRPEVSKIFCSRLAALDAASVAEWQTEIARVAESRPSAANVASLLIQHERLFERESLNPAEVRLLKSRLRVVPKSALEKWEVLALAGHVRWIPIFEPGDMRTALAMELIRRDEFFLNGQWDADQFQSQCDEASKHAESARR